MSVKLGDAQTKKLSSGRIYFRKKNETNWLDLGNCLSHKYEPDVQRADHMRAAGGFKQVDVSQVKSINPKYAFELDEHTIDLEQLKMLGTAAAEVVQAGGAVVAEVLCNANSKKGRTFFAAAQGLSAVTVKVGGVAKTLDVDYSIDLGSGAVSILPDGTIADNSTVTIDYTAAAVTMQPVNAFKELRVEGDIKYLEVDQHDTVPRQITEFFGQVHVTGWGENNLEDYNKVTLVAIPLSGFKVSHHKR